MLYNTVFLNDEWEKQKHKDDKKPTDKRTALVPPGCLLIVFTTVCYSRMKCKIIYHILKSLRCLFFSSIFVFSSLLCVSLFTFLPIHSLLFLLSITSYLFVFLGTCLYIFSFWLFSLFLCLSICLSGSWYISLGVCSLDYLMLASWPCGRINCIKHW